MAIISGGQTLSTTNLTDLLDGGASTLHSHAASAGPPTAMWSTTFDAESATVSRRFVHATTGDGATYFAGYGTRITGEGSSGGSASTKCTMLSYGENYHGGSPTFTCMFERMNTQAGGVSPTWGGTCYFGIGNVTVTKGGEHGAGHVFTNDHIGFKGVKVESSSDTRMYGSQADGTTETATASILTVSTRESIYTVILKINGSSSVDYYTRNGIADLSSATNISNNMMNDATYHLQWSTSNEGGGYGGGTNVDHTFILGASTWER